MSLWAFGAFAANTVKMIINVRNADISLVKRFGK